MKLDINQRLFALLGRAHQTGLSPEAAKLIGLLPVRQRPAWSSAFELAYRSGGGQLDLEHFSTWADAHDAEHDAARSAS